MHWRILTALIIQALLGGGAVLHAQESAVGQLQREGFWIGIGVGATQGSIDCSPCGPLVPNDPWDGGTGFGLYVAMGGAVRSNVLLGGELNVYGKRNSAQRRDATISGLSAILQYYPGGSRLYVKSGAGFGRSLMAGGGGLIASGGWAAQGGIGYDVPLGSRFALAPFGNFVQVFSSGAHGRNQGVAARGPRNPRYAQVGVGFHWY